MGTPITSTVYYQMLLLYSLCISNKAHLEFPFTNLVKRRFESNISCTNIIFLNCFNIAELQVSSDFSSWLNLKTAELILSISPIWFCTWSWGPSIPTVCLPSQSLPHSLSLSSLSCLGFNLHFPTQCPGLLLESGIQREPSLSFFLACFLSATQVCYRFFSDISSFCDCF